MRRMLLALLVAAAAASAGCQTSSNRFKPCWRTYVVSQRCVPVSPATRVPAVVRPADR